jgi:hypothetical protein
VGVVCWLAWLAQQPAGYGHVSFSVSAAPSDNWDTRPEPCYSASAVAAAAVALTAHLFSGSHNLVLNGRLPLCRPPRLSSVWVWQRRPRRRQQAVHQGLQAGLHKGSVGHHHVAQPVQQRQPQRLCRGGRGQPTGHGASGWLVSSTSCFCQP